MPRKRKSDLDDITPIDNIAIDKEKKRKKTELIIGIILLLLIAFGGTIMLFQNNNKTTARVAGASTEDEVVALKAEIDNLNKKIDDLNKNIETAKSVVSETTTTESSSGSDSSESSSSKSVGVININTASVSELDGLTGIGPTYAQRIVEYREANGGFKSIEELKNVKGIGDKTFDKLKDSVTI